MEMNPVVSGDVDVIISGLGPTGLVLAHILGRGGHRVVVLEREPVFYGNARAVYTDDECMRIFQSIGMADLLQEKMIQDCPVQLVRPDGEAAGRYLPRGREFGWPVVNFFYQPYLERSLAEALSRYPGVEIRRGRELTGFEQAGDSVNVTHRASRDARSSDEHDGRVAYSGDDDVQTLRASYLVGADGGRSMVRTLLGIELDGRRFPEPWLVVDLEMKEGEDGLHHLPYFNFVMNPGMPVVSCVQPDSYHRFEFMLMPGMTKEEMEQPETVRRLLSEYIDPEKFEVRRKLVYSFNALVARSWRDNRVLLAGDAAHMTPQFMGQGASSGFRDAANLGWKLDLVLKGLAGDGLLDSYPAERLDHAKAMIDSSVFFKDLVSTTNPLLSRLRDFTLKHVGPAQRYLERGGFKPKPVYTRGKFLGLTRRRRNGPEGTLSPQPEVRSFHGRRQRLDELLGTGFSLIGLGCNPLDSLSEANRVRMSRLDAQYVSLYPFGGRPHGFRDVTRHAPSGVQEVEDLEGSMIAWFRKAGFSDQAVLLLRPDRFVFAMVATEGLDEALTELWTQLDWSAVDELTPRTEMEPELNLLKSA